MNRPLPPPILKPLLRGHFHQAGFFFALGACVMLISESHGLRAQLAMTVYSLSLVGMFGISALYHRPNWNPRGRVWMKRLDHAAIFVLIAGTGTPLALLGMPEESGIHFLLILWTVAALGVIQSLFWVRAPKWLSAIFYVIMGWLALPYLPEFRQALQPGSVPCLLIGGLIYTLGAVVYAVRKPNPWPKVFGYHEIFHFLTIIAAAFHFVAIARLSH
jgi:hemolysin III